MASEIEVAAMRHAIVLAERGLGTTSPNPVVGCVVLDSTGTTVGEGYHLRPGGSHAEVTALAAAGARARGGTLVVSLEPCAHTGRTGPCTDAIRDAGIARVVVATADPSAAAAGGAAQLRVAGIEVEIGVLAGAAERANEAWLHAVQLGRPFVTWKYAASLDGRVAARDGSSRWVSGPESRADAHRLRARSDAILAGSGTVRADDPQLTVRVPGTEHQPLRVVVDTDARIASHARTFDGEAATLLAVAADASTAHLHALQGHVEALRLPRAESGLDLRELLHALHHRGVVSLLVEGGPTLASALLASGLVDCVVGYVAPALIGGDGRPALAGAGAATIDAARRLRLDDVTRTGGDVRLTARPTRTQVPSQEER